MNSALVLRHIAFEGLGCLSDVLAEQGYQVQMVDAPLQSFRQLDAIAPDLVIILGGPIGAFDEVPYPFLLEELEFIRARLASGKPILGICLGAQLIARALGAGVAPMGHKEIGFSPVVLTQAGAGSVLAPLAAPTPVLHWHGDQFEIPAQATLLAATQACPHQAFSVGTQVLALQFHLEVMPQELELWLVGHAGDLYREDIDPCALRSQAQKIGNAGAALARSIFTAWLAQLR